MVDLSCVSNAIAPFFDALCDVKTYTKVKDSTTKITSLQQSTLYSNQPCRVSFSKLASSVPNDITNDISLSAKLFISNSLTIPSGSDIVVTTQENVTYNFKSSSVAAIYPTHQELLLELNEVHA